jgi:hypothetical protein
MTRSALLLATLRGSAAEVDVAPVTHFSGATFCEAAPAINTAAGMTFMTAACGIDELLYAVADSPDAFTGERKHSTGGYASHRST